jgi:hypothetical protein
MEITFDHETHTLRKGDCLAMQLDGPVTFHNPKQTSARYAVVIVSEKPARR